MSTKSLFAIHKALKGIGGKLKSIKRLRPGDLLVETSSAIQTKYLLLTKIFLDSPVKINPHKTLNTSHGIISEPDLLYTSEAEILEGFSDQDVMQELWFQQDGATCHTARATIDLLKDTFGNRLISRFGPVNWPPRSCDLTPLDYFLGGYVKSLVYADKPQTLDHLEDNIRRVIADMRPQMLEKVIENWTSRLDYIRASRGNHMPEILIKM
ncbi:uncharacterized protein TNCV_4111601 [Trichonephila clavipes]|nr:uncharacterized protein TNCV_4111601 [Trichonephila clavipes]